MNGRAPPLTRTAPNGAGPRGSHRGRRTFVQRRLAVGAANDRFEHEAERVARAVTGPAMPVSSPPPVISPIGVQRMVDDDVPDEARAPAQRSARPSGPETPADDDELGVVQRTSRGGGPEASGPVLELEDDTAQRAAGGREASGPGAAGGAAPAAVDADIARMRAGPAGALDAPLRGRMEQHMGVDLGGVRVHDDRAAGAAADALNARAFTVGQDMFFGPGQYAPDTSAGQHLIAHETAHTVQQQGGSAGAQRIQRATKADAKSAVTKDPDATPTVIPKLEGDDWAVDFTAPDGKEGTITLPALQLPKVGGALKGATPSDAAAVADSGRSLPEEGKPFRLDPVPKRPEGKAYQTWLAYAEQHFSVPAKAALEARLKEQADAAPIVRGGANVYVLRSAGKKAKTSKTMLIGTTAELAMHDSILRPMLGPKGGEASLDADHILELQIGGRDAAENMWLLKSKYNRSAGSAISGEITKSIGKVLGAASKQLGKTKGATTPKKLPTDALDVKRNWVLRFRTVKLGTKLGTVTTFWTKAQMLRAEQIKHFSALSDKELIQQGFVFKAGEVPSHINVFPGKTGGRVARFDVKGEKLKRPKFFYRGLHIIDDVPFVAPTAETKNSVIASIPVRRTKKKAKDSDIIVFADKTIDLRHDENLGFGAYITRNSLVAAFRNVEFNPLSPLSFPDVQITPDGELSAFGSIASSKALLPQLQIPIRLRGDEIVLSFPIPTERLSLGPVKVTEAALNLGVGPKGFFMEGAAGIAVDQLGSGRLVAKTTKRDTEIAGKFIFDFDFVEKAELDATYSLARDDFEIAGTMTVKKGSLPGVESGSISVAVTRETFGLTGSLALGGLLSGSSITVGYTPKAGLLIEGKDLPLPVDKLPGVSGATVTVRARRSPDTGEWAVDGAGKASLAAGGASGSLDITFDGDAVLFAGRVDVAKGPAAGWLDITATNRAVDDAGEPVEGGPVGELKIWGKGEASLAFGKVLTGTAGIEYTPTGQVIISGEVALPPTFDLFGLKPYTKPLINVTLPDFWIWGVKVGPVGFGIFAFVDARVDFTAFVGPGQLRDTKVEAVIDLDKPEDATVEGNAKFHVPAFAGFVIDVGGGLKAQAGIAYVKGRVGIDGTLGLGAEANFDVGVSWNRADGFAVKTLAEVKARPKFSLGVNASVSAGVDLWPVDITKTWGPWRKKLGEFGPDMELSASFPVAWSEQQGLDLDLANIVVKKPALDAKALMMSAFDVLV